MSNIIDSILDDVRARPDTWRAAFVASEDVNDALLVAWDVSEGRLRQPDAAAVWRDVLQATADQRGVVGATRVVLRALAVWPESSALLDLTPDALRTIISTHEGDVKHQAVLLLPAVIARQSSTV